MNKYYGVTVVENSGILKTEWATTNFPHNEVLMKVAGWTLYKDLNNPKQIVHAVSSFPEHKYGRDDMHQMYRLIHM
jgi:hypothetical protein